MYAILWSQGRYLPCLGQGGSIRSSELPVSPVGIAVGLFFVSPSHFFAQTPLKLGSAYAYLGSNNRLLLDHTG